jgi:DNA-3-methyladenine glycosylase II
MKLHAAAPFHLEATVRVLQRLPVSPVDRWEHGEYVRLLRISGVPMLFTLRNEGSLDEPDLRLRAPSATVSESALDAAAAWMRHTLGLELDPAPLQRDAERLPALRSTARALRGMRPPRFTDLFDTFLNVVPYQQLSLDAGAAILARLVERFGEHVTHEGARYSLFPTPAAIAAAETPELIATGLSRAKAQTLQRLARLVTAGELTQEALTAMPTPEALAALRRSPGIGPWSAALVMLRGFGRLEVFPPGDSGAQRSLTTLLGVAQRAALESVIGRFGERRGYLYFCGLGSKLLAKGLITPAR